MSAIIKIDQVGLPAGVADRSRSDGLDDSSVVTLTSVSPGTTNTWKLLWVPRGDATAVASLIVSGASVTFTPDSDVYGNYRIMLTVDAGLITESVSIRTFGIRTPVAGLCPPALNERASESASLEDDGADQISASETNEAEVSGPFTGGSYGGWYPALIELFEAVESLAYGVTRVLSGVTPLTVGTITDGQFVKRDGATLISAAVDTTPADGSITLAKMANLAQDRIIGRATASTGVPEAITCTAAGRALLDDADNTAQRTTLGLAALATLATVGTSQIDNDAVTLAKMANLATNTVIGRSTAGTGDPEAITCTAAGRALLDDADASAQRTTLGLGSLAVASSVAISDLGELWSVLASDYSPGADATPFFRSTHDVVTVASDKTYLVDFAAYVNMGTASSRALTVALIGDGTAVCDLDGLYTVYSSSSPGGGSVASTAIGWASVGGIMISQSALAVQYRFMRFSGRLKVTTGGTLIPKLTSNGSTTTMTVVRGAYLVLRPLGDGSAVQIGGWS